MRCQGTKNAIRVIRGILCVSELISSDAKRKEKRYDRPFPSPRVPVHVFHDTLLRGRHTFMAYPRRQILDTPPRPKELPYRCTCAGGQTNLVRPPPRPSPPFLPTYRAACLQSFLGSVLSTARGFKIKFGTRRTNR